MILCSSAASGGVSGDGKLPHIKCTAASGSFKLAKVSQAMALKEAGILMKPVQQSGSKDVACSMMTPQREEVRLKCGACW